MLYLSTRGGAPAGAGSHAAAHTWILASTKTNPRLRRGFVLCRPKVARPFIARSSPPEAGSFSYSDLSVFYFQPKVARP